MRTHRRPWSETDEIATRTRWFLTELGRFPTYDEIVALRDLVDHRGIPIPLEVVLDEWQFMHAQGADTEETAASLGMAHRSLTRALERAKHDGDPRATGYTRTEQTAA